MAEVGRPRIFENELEISKAFEEYKLDLKEQAKEWEHIQYVGKEAERKVDHYKLPLTLEGFYIFCRKKYGDIKAYFLNTNNAYDEFSTICSHIKDEIRNNQILGGMVGVYNPSITARLNGLADKQENRQVDGDGKDVKPTVLIYNGQEIKL